MRIGIDATFLEGAGRYTGMGVYTRGIARGLAAVVGDHDVFLLGYGERPADLPESLRWERMRLLPVGRLGPWLSHQIVLPRVARRFGFDVVHVPGVNLRLSQPGVPIRLPCPLVVTVHDAIPRAYYGVQGPPLPWRLRQGYRIAMAAARRADLVLTVSETSRRDLATHLAIDPERIRVVYNGVDLPPALTAHDQRDALARLGIATPYLFYAGSYEPRKNLLGVVAAYQSLLARSDLPPLVALVERQSGHREAVLRAIERSGVGNRLRLVHSLSDDDLAALYRGALAFIYPSHYEGFGFTPLQALGCGVPVIAADAGALPEVLGDAARYVDPRNVEELARAIADLIDRRDERARLASRGPLQASRFRWDDAARQTLQEYAGAVAARARTPATTGSHGR